MYAKAVQVCVSLQHLLNKFCEIKIIDKTLIEHRPSPGQIAHKFLSGLKIGHSDICIYKNPTLWF